MGTELSLTNQNVIGYLSNTGRDPLKSQKISKSAFNVGLLSTPQRNVILIVITGGPIKPTFSGIWVRFSLISSNKKLVRATGPTLTNLLDLRMTYMCISASYNIMPDV